MDIFISPPDTVTPQTLVSLLVFFIFYFAVIVAILIIAFIVLRRVLKAKIPVARKYRMNVLQIAVPRAGVEEDQEKNTLDLIKEKIGVAESLYAVIGGLKPERTFKTRLLGRHDHVSLEMVARGGQIYFYIAVPLYLRKLLEEQIHAQYPDAHIEEIDDYNIFTAQGVTLGTYLTLERASVFPIKTYEEMESDPMGILANSLSKVKEHDGAAIQFVVRSAPRSWRRKGVQIAREMQQGKSLSQVYKPMWMKAVSLPVTALMSVFHSKKKGEESQGDDKYTLSPMEQEMVKHLENKASKAGFDANIRIVVSASSQPQAQGYINDILQSFSQYSIYQYGNRFKVSLPYSKDAFFEQFIHRDFNERKKLVINTEELASLYHLPLPTTDTPNIAWLTARKAAPPIDMPRMGLLLGKTNYRGEQVEVRITDDDRRRHMYIVGRSGTGKSTYMENMAIQDIQNGKGMAIIDPHGDFVDHVLPHIPKERAEDVIIFSPGDTERPIGLNMLEADTPEEMDFAAQEMVSIFYKLVPNPDMIGPMFEHNMRNAMLTLMSNKKNPGTLADIPRIFTDTAFQKEYLKHVDDPMVRAFWEKEMAQTPESARGEMLGYLISKVGRFVENEMVRNIIGQSKSGFDFRDVMDKQKILLVNLSKGKVGEVNSNLLGLIIVAKLQMAALTRAHLPEDERKDFYLYIDEFQNFVTDSIATILSEARKYRLNLTIAHQYMNQLVKNNDTSIRDAVLGNAGTMVSFRIGIEDAETLAKEFQPVFSQSDLINIERYTAYIKLLINGTASRPFNMHTIPPYEGGNTERGKAIVELSRLKFGRPRAEVASEILERTKLGESTTKSPVPNEPSL
ncbi:MAG: type IV secretory system conjugative DNA transfer family protein [Patescibacteria group bacterium]